MFSVHLFGVAFLILVAVYKLAGHLLYQFTLARFTVVNELEALGQDRAPGDRLKGIAVICGGRCAESSVFAL